MGSEALPATTCLGVLKHGFAKLLYWGGIKKREVIVDLLCSISSFVLVLLCCVAKLMLLL